MALTPTVKATANNPTDDNDPSVTTSSFTPADNSLLVAICLSQRLDTGSLTMSISGGGLTWTSRALTSSAALDCAGRIFTAPVTTGASMTVQFSTTNGYGAAIVAVVEVTGYNTSAPTGVILQAVTGSRSGAYSPGLSGTSAADSLVIAGGVADFNTATKGAAWTNIYSGTSASGGTSLRFAIEYIAGAVSAANWAALNSSFSTAAVGVEIKAAAGGDTNARLLGGDLINGLLFGRLVQ